MPSGTRRVTHAAFFLTFSALSNRFNSARACEASGLVYTARCWSIRRRWKQLTQYLRCLYFTGAWQ
jgi:hypothetical protein